LREAEVELEVEVREAEARPQWEADQTLLQLAPRKVS
jgi:hypothetical protein